jgi:hypothetical protein
MISMSKILLRKNQVSLCHKNVCINTYGKNAEMIAKGATVMLLLIGVAALVRSASN